MPIKHAFTSPKSDGGDATLVRPTDWNADHDVTAVWVAVYHNTTQGSVANSTTTPLDMNSERSDTFGFHDNATNNNRLTVPTGYGGIYLVIATCFWDTNATGVRILSIRKNGADIIGAPAVRSGTTANGLTQEITHIVPLADGDWVEAAVWQNSGAARTVGSTNSWEQHGLAAYLIGG